MKWLLTSLTLLAPAAFCQTTPTWKSAHVLDIYAATFPVALEILDDEGCLSVDGLTGTDFSEARPVAWRIARHARGGNLTWEREVAMIASAPSPSTAHFVADASPGGASAIAVQRGTTATLIRHDALGGRAPNVDFSSPTPNLLVQPHFVRVEANGETTVGLHESSPFAHPSVYVAVLMRLDAAGQVLWRQEVPASDVRFDSAGPDRVVAVLDSQGAPGSSVDVLVIDSAGVTVRSSRVDLGIGSVVKSVRYDASADRTVLFSTGGSAGTAISSVDANGALTGVYVSTQHVYPDLTVDPVSGWVWLRPVSGNPQLFAIDAGGALAAQPSDPAVLWLSDLAARDGGGLVGLGTVTSEPGLMLIDFDAAGTYQGHRLLEHRPTQAVPRSGNALDVVSRGKHVVAKASFRLAISSQAPLDFIVQGALDGELGQAFCPQPANSTGQAARLAGAGTDSAADNLVTLVADRLPVGAFGLFVTSRTQGLVPGAGGSLGTLCLGGAIGRFVGSGQIAAASPAGRLVLPLDLNALPQGSAMVPALAGQTWNFQAWYRDFFGGAASNFTNALEVSWN